MDRFMDQSINAEELAANLKLTFAAVHSVAFGADTSAQFRVHCPTCYLLQFGH